MTSKVAFSQGGAPIDFDLDAECTLVAVPASPGTTSLHAALSNISTSNRAKQEPAAFNEAALQLGRAGALFMFAGGVVSELRVPSGLGAIAVNVYREIASSLQFPDAALNGTYRGEECDTTGRYVAVYHRDSSSNTWHRQKERYVSLLGMGAASPSPPLNIVPSIIHSEASIELSASGRPKAVEGYDEIALEGAQTPVRGTTVIALRQVAERNASNSELAADAELVNAQRIAAGEAYGGAPAIDALDEARIGGMTFDSVVARLERLARTKHPTPAPLGAGPTDASSAGEQLDRAGMEEFAKLFEALAALYRREPGTVAKAVSKVKLGSPASTALVGALGSASTVEAQKALVALTNDEAMPHDIRAQANLALLRTPRPHTEAIDTLTARLASRPFDSTALFGLGTYSRRLRDAGDSSGAAALGELLLAQLLRASIASDKVKVLGALGNSGYGGALQAIRPYLAEDSEEIRAAAVGALRSMRESDVDNLIAFRLAQDTSSSVRTSAIAAARVRDPSDLLAHSLADAAVHATDPQVRYQATELMAAWLPRRPEFREALQAVARDDAEPRVRDRAQASL